MVLGLKGFQPSAPSDPEPDTIWTRALESQGAIILRYCNYLERNAGREAFKRESLVALPVKLKQRYK